MELNCDTSGLMLEEVNIDIHEGEYLTAALQRHGYEAIPSNMIINKRIPGLGATYGEFMAQRNSIIIEPFTPVINGKISDFPNALAVHEPVKLPQIKTYLSSKTEGFKKIVTTPEGLLKKVIPAAVKEGINLFKDYFCLYDEAEHVTTDTGYRRTMSDVMLEFLKFENKAMVSATPLKPNGYTIGLFHQAGFKWMNVNPTYDYREDITIITTKSFLERVKDKVVELLDTGSEMICIFYNSTNGISDIYQYLEDANIIKEDDSRIFCSEKSVKKAKQEKILLNTKSELEYPLSKVNFFTSRFFPAVDINIDVPCDIILLSNYAQAAHTLIDPFTSAIQAQGRFRNKFDNGRRYNTLTLITTTPDELEYKSDEDIHNEITTHIEAHQSLKSQYDVEEDEVKKKAIEKDINRLCINDYLNKDKAIDPFSVENVMHIEKVKSFYSSAVRLEQAFNDTGFFNVTTEIDNSPMGEDDFRLLQSSHKKSNKKRYKLIVDYLKKVYASQEPNETYLRLIETQCVQDGWLIDAFKLLGAEPIETADYKKSKIEKIIQEKIKEIGSKKISSNAVLQDIIKLFTPYIKKKLEQEKALDMIGHVFDVHGIKYSRHGKIPKAIDTMVKLSATTFDLYFDYKTSNHTPTTINIQGIKKIVATSGEEIS